MRMSKECEIAFLDWICQNDIEYDYNNEYQWERDHWYDGYNFASINYIATTEFQKSKIQSLESRLKEAEESVEKIKKLETRITELEDRLRREMRTCNKYVDFYSKHQDAITTLREALENIYTHHECSLHKETVGELKLIARTALRETGLLED